MTSKVVVWEELTLSVNFHILVRGDGIHLELPSEKERLMTPASWQEFFLLRQN